MYITIFPTYEAFCYPHTKLWLISKQLNAAPTCFTVTFPYLTKSQIQDVLDHLMIIVVFLMSNNFLRESYKAGNKIILFIFYMKNSYFKLENPNEYLVSLEPL